MYVLCIIIHQTHYEKSDWSRAFNQFTVACELDMINALSAVDIAFIMSSSTSAWLLSPLAGSPQKQNGWMLRFCFWGWIMWKMYNKTITEFGFRMISWMVKTSCLCYLPQPSASADNTDLGFDNSWYPQPHPIIVYWFIRHVLASLHFNENVHRECQISKDGTPYMKVTYPKFKLGDEVVREVAVPPTYGMLGNTFFLISAYVF